MKKVLMVFPRVPYPPIGGDRIKNYNLLKILSKYYKITLVVLTDSNLNENAEEFIKEHTTSHYIFKKNKLQFIFSAARSFFNKSPIQVNLFYFKDVNEHINSLAESHDFCIASLIRTTEYLKQIKLPKICDMADSIGLNYQNSWRMSKSLLWKIAYRFEYKRLLAYERKTMSSFDKTFMFNRQEVAYFNHPKAERITYGANHDLLSYSKTDEKYFHSIAFLGKMDYQPNIDAIIWFLDHVMNKLDSHIKLNIVGSNPTKMIQKKTSALKNVELTGYVEDPYVYINSATLSIAPMQTGGGIQTKILESMSLGAINLISSKAALPIGVKNEKEVLIADEPQDYIEKINDVFKNKDKYSFLKENAREYIKKNYSWDLYEQQYIRTIKKLLE